MLPEHVFESLNAAQLAAADHPGGSLLIVAGAGTGKTMTLACRVARLIERGTPPGRLLLLTFSRRAAREMLSRTGRMVDADAAGRVWGGTFHSVGLRLLRLHGRAIGLAPDATVLDQADGADLMNLIREDLGLAARGRRFPRKDTLAAIYSRTVNAGVALADVLGRAFPWCARERDGIADVFRAYTHRKRRHHLLDYDDLLLFWRALLRDPRAGAEVAARFNHVLVDEYQDTNAVQADIVEGFTARGVGVTVVGDDAQAIYGFRAATVRNILEFPARFPGTAIVRLEQNYRSTPPILALSNAVIAGSPQRHEKTLWSERDGARRPRLVTCLDEAEQSDAVCRTVLEHREAGTLLREQAVLFRAAHHSDLLEVELARRNIPFVKYGGLKFLEAAHVKDLLAVLRVVENPWDEVGWFRVLQLLDGVGPATARRLMIGLGVGEAASGRSPLARLVDAPPPLPASARADGGRLRETARDLTAEDLPAAVQVARARVFLEPVVRRVYASAEARLRDLEQLENLAARAGSRRRFLSELVLDPPDSTGDLAGPPLLDEDYLVLSTMHSAKGGEWDVVHVIHAADGMIPSDMATGNANEIEEERRLLYVALTRAREALHVYRPLRYYRRPRGTEDPHAWSQVSRFLTAEVRTHADEEGPAHPVEPAGIPSATPGDGAAEVDEYLGSLWRG